MFALVQGLGEAAMDQERRVLIEELKLELSNLERVIEGRQKETLSRLYLPNPLLLPVFSPSTFPNPQSTCLICQLSPSESLQLTVCSHRLCTHHISQDFANKYLRELGKVRCPVQGCGKPLDEGDMRKAVGTDLVEELKCRVRRLSRP